MEKKPEVLAPTIPHQSNEFINDTVYDGTKKDKLLPRAAGKGILLTMWGSFKTTFAGSPVATGKGVLESLLPFIEIEDGNGDLRNISPSDMRRLAKAFKGSDSPALYQHNSQVLSSPTVGLFTFAGLATTQFTCFRETVHIPFECEFAEADFFETLLQYNGSKDNILRMDFADSLKAIQKPSDATVVTYENIDIKIRVEYLQTGLPGGGKRWIQRPEERNYTAATNADVIKLDSVRNLAMLELLVTYGTDKTPVTFDEAEKIYFDLLGKRGGKTVTIKNKVSLADLMYSQLSKKKQSSIIDGYGIMNFINGNQLQSALGNDFDDLDLRVYLDSSLSQFGVGYNVRALINEVS